MKPRFIFAITLLAVAWDAPAEPLPRKSKANESYPNVEVLYDFVTAPDGKRLRMIVTKPKAAKVKLPVVFLAGWLSCDSVEAPADTRDASGLFLRGLAQLPEFSLARMDKQGVGDSEGDCATTDFDAELAGYRAAFRALKNYDFLDPGQIYILGMSNGGGFAPLIPQSDAEQQQVRGYVSVGGWVKTWFEHMLEIERRRFSLMGKSPAEVNDRMKKAATLYHEWLIKGRHVDAIIKEAPELTELWPAGNDHAHLYGRPLAFYEQLQKLNLAAAWSNVKVPALILHGQYDWIMSREDPELMAQYVNATRPGLARFMEVPEMGHTFQHYLSMSDAFADKTAAFETRHVQLVSGWLKEQLKK
jgi:pimeloyl-ACP methyl ester carboxylesterase